MSYKVIIDQWWKAYEEFNRQARYGTQDEQAIAHHRLWALALQELADYHKQWADSAHDVMRRVQ